jgi:hypothetical protein
LHRSAFRWPATVAAFLVLFGLSNYARSEVRFNRDVRPILSENCLACHGPDARKRKAGLRLDEPDTALKPADSGDTAIVPGRPESSELVARIDSKDPDDIMPPPKSNKRLTPSQREILRQWIAGGAKYEPHWAFVPIQRPPVPAVQDCAWPRNPVDNFILVRLEAEHLSPAPPAAPETLLRRVSYGLTGLPPTPEDLAAFSSGHDDASYNALLDRLLGSTAYGEHWARHWMDLVRYADSAGYELDYLFTESWRYRDWLVKAFTSHEPMDRFIEAQIAGDELWPGDKSAADAVLFLAIGPRRFEGGIQRTKERQNEWLTDLADTTGSAFLGVTMGCTRCHDHKFDPWTQDDYYGLQADFADCTLREQRIRSHGGNNDTTPAFIRVLPLAMPETVHVLRRGEVELPLREAAPAFPAALPDGGPIGDGNQRRAALARWLVSDRNPLVARVLVNRIWQWLFGQGLVRTASDFGRQGEAPSHPELLDWLASELISSGWNLGHIQRLILDSATYRQASLASESTRRADPDHRLLAGFPRQRLQAEELRDSLLSVSGTLNRQAFGPPVIPPVEPWMLAGLRNAHWEPTTNAAEVRRRSLYLIVRRSMKLPFFEAFNQPDTVTSCPVRDRTVVSSQALTLFNSPDTFGYARALAGRLWTESDGEATTAVELAWRLVFGREIRSEERRRTLAFLQEREAAWAQALPTECALPAGFAPVDSFFPIARGAAWVEWCLALLNANEFVYVD